MNYSFDRLFEAYLPAVRGELRSFFRIECALVRLDGFFRGRDLTALRRSDISAYIAHRKNSGVTNSTINREINIFSAAINYAVKHWEWPLPNPVKGMFLKQPEGRLRWLTDEESQRLIGAAQSSRNPCLADFVRLALHTGMRKDELLKLEWHRVDLKARRIQLDGIHTKSGRRRFIPLNATAVKVLKDRIAFRLNHCPRSPWVFAHEDGRRVSQIWNCFQKARRRAGIVDFRIHDLRHTFASWLVSAGVPLTEVRDLLGHASIRETERYAHLAPDRLSVAVRVLDRLAA